MNTVFLLRDAAGSCSEVRCLRFTLVRDRYQPFASLEAVVADSGMLPVSAALSVGAYAVFDGIVRTAERVTEGGVKLLRITARSWSEALLRNQLLPGLRFQVTLESLMTDYPLPHMSYETVPEPVNYIYIEDRTVLWDAVIAFCYKLNGSMPFVRADNQVCVFGRQSSEPVMLPADRLFSDSDTANCAGMISRIEMADIDGTYGVFSMSNPEAETREIVRVKRIQFDKRFLHDPYEGMAFHIALSNRRLSGRTLRYAGYCGEDLEDWVGLGADFRAHVSRIVLHGDDRGIVTEDSFCYDSFCNRATGAHV